MNEEINNLSQPSCNKPNISTWLSRRPLSKPKFSKKVPGSLVAIILVTVGVYCLKMYGGITCIDTIGDRFSIKAQLPEAAVPALDWEAIKNLFPVAITIAVLGAIESLLSAAVADGVIGDRHDSNTELIAQGIANFVSPIFGGIPATGAIARTMTNINNGGKSPVAGIVHAVVLLLILLFLMPLAQYIPMACLAGVLVIVSYNMSGWRVFKGLLKNPKSDVAVLLITFFLTVIFDLTVAIEVGLVIACVLFMKRVMETTKISVITDEIDPNNESDLEVHEEHLMIPQGVEVYEINGPYFFGIAPSAPGRPGAALLSAETGTKRATRAYKSSSNPKHGACLRAAPGRLGRSRQVGRPATPATRVKPGSRQATLGAVSGEGGGALRSQC